MESMTGVERDILVALYYINCFERIPCFLMSKTRKKGQFESKTVNEFGEFKE